MASIVNVVVVSGQGDVSETNVDIFGCIIMVMDGGGGHNNAVVVSWRGVSSLALSRKRSHTLYGVYFCGFVHEHVPGSYVLVRADAVNFHLFICTRSAWHCVKDMANKSSY